MRRTAWRVRTRFTAREIRARAQAYLTAVREFAGAQGSNELGWTLAFLSHCEARLREAIK